MVGRPSPAAHEGAQLGLERGGLLPGRELRLGFGPQLGGASGSLRINPGAGRLVRASGSANRPSTP